MISSSRSLIPLVFACALFGLPASGQELTDSQQKNEELLIDAIREQQIGNHARAIGILEKLRHEPQFSAAANFHLSKLYEKTGKYPEALDAIKQSIAADPTNKWYSVVEANLHESQANYCEAASAYERLCHLEANQYEFYENAALQYVKCQNLEKAAAVLNRAFKKFGYFPPLSLKRAWLHELQGNTKKMIEVLENARKEYPFHVELLPPLIEWYSKNGREAEAIPLLELLSEKDPSHPLVSQSITHGAGAKDWSALEKEVKNVLLNLDQKILALVNHLHTANSPEQINSLIPLSVHLTEAYPSEPKAWALLGDIYYKANDLPKAIDAYETAIDKGPVPFSLWKNILSALLIEAKTAKLERMAEKGLDFYPNQPFIYFSLAQAQYFNGKYDEALGNIEQLVLMTQNNPAQRAETLALQAKILQVRGQLSLASEVWSSIDMDKAGPHTKLEKMLFDMEKGQDVPFKEFLRMADLAQLSLEAKLAKLAEFCYLSKNYETAKNYIEQSLGIQPDRFETLLLAGKIYAALKQFDLAKKHLRVALLKTDCKPPVERILQSIP